jgi:glc operon protein GlcG
MFKKPTRFFEELINSSGKGRTVMTALENFTPLIGGIPITVDGQIVGGVGVSGAASADQDEQLAIAGSKAFEANTMSGDPAPAVSYWEKAKVEEAFSKGAVLFDGSDGRNYMVHASRREKPGQAEIHTKDADVIYVLQGSATFIPVVRPWMARPSHPKRFGAAVSMAVRHGRLPRETSSSFPTVCRTSFWKSPIRSSTTL